MRKLTVVAAGLACLGAAGGGAVAAAGQDTAAERAVVISNDGGELARVPLAGGSFAVSYRNSLYGSLAEERYTALPDGRYRLRELAADQLAVLEEYYAVPGPARPAGGTDRRNWTAAPDPAHPLELTQLSIAATDLGQRTLHVPGSPPVELWRLVDTTDPFVVLTIKESP